MRVLKVKKMVKVVSEETILIDDADFELVSQYCWHVSRGYVLGIVVMDGIKQKVLLHRFLLKPKDGELVDHVNGNGLDNRRVNLRICTYAENSRNSCGKRKVGRTSCYKGVSLYRSGKWKAQITVNRHNLNIGSFESERHAALAYDIWARELHGIYARTNFQSAV